ncbi:hypothetical protein VPH35_101598 [Triticum aestivum]|uniref:Uncharacterized protein n=1 Tax=Triticum aestivum TaxID=4565 RepID=H6U263_WHEAT|nr:unknown protein [Triticum aestivum]
MPMWSLISCVVLIIFAGSAGEVEALKSTLAQAKEQARMSQAAADKAATDLKAEQVTRRQYEEQVTEVEHEFKDATSKCETLEEKSKAQEADLTKAIQEAKEARTESRAAREEIKQAKQIAAGKPFLLQSIFGDWRYALLNRLWSATDAFADLPRSATDVAQYFRAQEGNTTEKLFWSQYLAPERPALLNNQMMQLAELHRMSGLAMKDIIVRLWPAGPIPSSYFGLVKRLSDALPRVEAVKRSTCIEGGRMAFARVKMHSAKMKAAIVAVEGPPEGKDYRKPERYFEDILEGACLIEGQCSKDIMFE